jgi:hypothetical protein
MTLAFEMSLTTATCMYVCMYVYIYMYVCTYDLYATVY